MKTLVIANQKGGVGKTATAHALGAALAGAGKRVLLVDCDPQSSLTQSAGVEDASGRSLAEVLGGAQPGTLVLKSIIKTISPGLDLAPADIALAVVELGLNSRLGREGVLRKALAGVANQYDVAIVDCPPSLGLLTVAALAAGDAVIIPTQAQLLDMRGVALFLNTMEQIRAELNPGLETLGVLVTFYDGRLNTHRDGLESMRVAGLPVLSVVIGRSIRVAEAAGAGQAITQYDARNPQASAYQNLAEIVLQWLKSKTPA